MKKEVKEFEQNFYKETKEFVFVLSNNCVSSIKFENENYYTIDIKSIAYKDLSNSIIKEGNITISKKDKNTKYYDYNIKDNSIVKLKVRHSKFDDNCFLFIKLISNNYNDKSLSSILENYNRFQFYNDNILGTFKLNETIGMFENKINWIGNEIKIYFDNLDVKYNKYFTDSLKKIIQDKKYLDKKLKEYIYSNIIMEEYKNFITKKDFISKIILESINIYKDYIEFCFDDGEIFGGHLITINADNNYNFKEVYISG
ncbi:DUF2262 domain-containing protein [Brachyspira pulli]|uniref:DUF7021 domain-containing protein n=1 Tax=Brachyspira pulli TaxID=310721 RepID=UPI00262A2D26|nr:DUF2262 domain-containing protein [uncultured Brachyspira sp.]